MAPISVSVGEAVNLSAIRFVSHPLFAQPDAREQIERLKPIATHPEGLHSGEELSATTPIGKLCEHSLFSRKEEQYWFLCMNYEKFAANQTSDNKRKDHLAQATAIRNRIVLANARLLVSIASQFSSPAASTEELVSEGVVPLLKAVELFDVSRGWAFGTYATHVLRNHFRRTGQRTQRKNRLTAHFTESQMVEVEDAGIPPAVQQALAARHNHLASQCLSELPATDQIILRTRFGFDDPAHPQLRSYAEVGQVVGLSKERVRVRAHRALEQLRETAQKRQWEFPELEAWNLGV